MAVTPDRRLSFAEFGVPDGRTVLWFHGTPGSRRQIPTAARRLALSQGFRLVGVDRPGIGSSSPHVYGSVSEFATDIERVLDCLGIDRFAVVGLSGGGPYALSVAHAHPDRVVAVGVLGGVAPTVGVDAIDGGLVALARRTAPLVALGRVPLGVGLTRALRLARPLSSQAIGLYARMSPEGDRRILSEPEFKSMFVDDLINGSRKQFTAPLSDLLLFSRHWGFEVGSVTVPVRWWHGDEDNIVPLAHGEHVVSRLPNATLTVRRGESHLSGMALADEILGTVGELWDKAGRAGR